MRTQAKTALCRTSLLALGMTFELASDHAPELAAELLPWDDGRRVGIGVLPNGPHITIEKRGARLAYLGQGLADPHVSILFKNLDSAVLVFTAQIGAHHAVAENRVIVRGSNHHAMEATRAMAIVQTYLFPGILLKNTFKRPPRLTRAQLLAKGRVYAALVPALVRGARRVAEQSIAKEAT
jgi:hypothetical protein